MVCFAMLITRVINNLKWRQANLTLKRRMKRCRHRSSGMPTQACFSGQVWSYAVLHDAGQNGRMRLRVVHA
jgi:hypothetical protein